ncbi:peptidoglycan-binding protein [Rhizomicrobium electricum]|uniref:Peptidoglycan binding-like domain-containing protein n=1 Tax=Rhizomicrobium electricum TaxID=480070 RepID=A0ABN1F1S3_9PROT|nr:hypothetical protein [Rhizomicrobium electricum]
MEALYQKSGLVLQTDGLGDPAAVKALQHDLRKLGYLRAGIDGVYGSGTAAAVKALQYDLLNNDGGGTDGRSPIGLSACNQKTGGGTAVTKIDGMLDQDLAQIVVQLVGEPKIGLMPRAPDVKAANASAMAALAAMSNTTAPPPFIAAMVVQESNGCHYHVPAPGDEDTYVTVGLDRNDKDHPERITSRGYGLGQFTFFHHPLSVAEVESHVADPAGNVANAFAELRDKFDHFVAGKSGADDRAVEHPALPLRLCRYPKSDPRYMRDCKACALAARRRDITRGTPVYIGSSASYQPTQYYPSADYPGVPVRADFPCDWPYAARRYNGAGVNSYHYQARILRNLLR